MDDETKQTIKVYEKMGSDYLDSIEKIPSTDLYKFIKIIKPGGLVLDVGCAGGRDTETLIQQGFQVIGVDLVEKFLERARKRVPEATFVNQNLLELDYKDNTFDAIWAHAVLMHLKKADFNQIMKKFYRFLKPGGKIHIRVKKGEGEHWVTDKLSPEQKRFFSFFQNDEMEEIMKKAGFNIILSDTVQDEVRDDLYWVWIWAKK